MASLYCRFAGVFFESSGGVFDHLGVDSSRVGRFSFFKFVDGVIEFLHRVLLHCLLVLLTSPKTTWHSHIQQGKRIKSSKCKCKTSAQVDRSVNAPVFVLYPRTHVPNARAVDALWCRAYCGAARTHPSSYVDLRHWY